MKVLFDQNIPRDLAHHLPQHDVVRAITLGWDRLRNGELLAKAEANGFDVMVTADQSMSYQQNLKGRKLAVVVLGANNWPLIEPHVVAIADAVDTSMPGSFLKVRCAPFRRMPGRKQSGPAL